MVLRSNLVTFLLGTLTLLTFLITGSKLVKYSEHSISILRSIIPSITLYRVRRTQDPTILN
jgi:hypothetical protein